MSKKQHVSLQLFFCVIASVHFPSTHKVTRLRDASWNENPKKWKTSTLLEMLIPQKWKCLDVYLLCILTFGSAGDGKFSRVVCSH